MEVAAGVRLSRLTAAIIISVETVVNYRIKKEGVSLRMLPENDVVNGHVAFPLLYLILDIDEGIDYDVDINHDAYSNTY